MEKQNVSRNPEDKNERLAEICQLILEFSHQYFDDELEDFCFNLAEALSRKRKVDIRRGKSEQWAASIVYVIARVNFLFDKKSESHITVDQICDFFNTKKSTTGAKATQIEKLCDVHHGRIEYCYKDIADMFTFYKTEDGLIVPKAVIDRQVDRMLASYGLLDDDDEIDNDKPNLSIEEQREIEKEKQLETAKERAERKPKDENQLGLFHD